MILNNFFGHRTANRWMKQSWKNRVAFYDKNEKSALDAIFTYMYLRARLPTIFPRESRARLSLLIVSMTSWHITNILHRSHGCDLCKELSACFFAQGKYQVCNEEKNVHIFLKRCLQVRGEVGLSHEDVFAPGMSEKLIRFLFFYTRS